MTKKHSKKSPNAQLKLELAKNDSLIRTYGWECFADLGVFCTFKMKITPAIASNMLKRNTKNRRKKPASIKLYAEEMTEQTWELTHQGAAFRDIGILADGQNRLQAIINSGIAQEMLVTFGVTEAAMLVIDTHRVRADHDALKIDGCDEVQSKHTAVAKRMMGIYSKRISRTILKEFYLKHKAAICASCELLSKSGMSQAEMKCVIARAYYTLDYGVLERFCHILSSPTFVPENQYDIAPIMLSQWYSRLNSRSGQSVGYEISIRCQWALNKFDKKRVVTKLGKSTKQLYPLPEEKE